MISEKCIFQFSKLVTDYRLEPINEVRYFLKEGYHLFGNPLAIHTQDDQYQVLQAVVKIKPPIGDIDIDISNIELTVVQKKCLLLLAADLSVNEIADRLHRSVRTVEKILSDLRYRFKCKKNTGLVVKACYLGFIDEDIMD